jgi:hypothetical protein
VREREREREREKEREREREREKITHYYLFSKASHSVNDCMRQMSYSHEQHQAVVKTLVNKDYTETRPSTIS